MFLSQETENLHGELKKGLEKFRTNHRLFDLLCKYKEIFGPLPPPSAGCPLVLIDIELKEEWEGNPLRQRCGPMSINEQQEINLQAEELLKAGLAEVFPPGEIPHVCSPTFLVDKKDSKTKRMVIQYRKLNARTKPHAGYLPNMDELVESLAKCKLKSKLDMRSGFWQVGLTERAKNLSTFCIPSGRCLRPLCMMFGLQGAPGIFQELMEILISQCKQDPEVRKILETGHLASFFDDTGIGTQNEEEHFYLLEKYFEICKKNQIRIKLSKCSFLEIETDYLGFSLGWGTWKPSAKGVSGILKSEIKNQKDLRKFLGAMNFYRRHVKNFTFSSAPLTELLKKNVKWHWQETEQKCFEELKAKIAALEILGTPRSSGEIIMITDSSDLGGGSTLFQWQTLDPKQIPEKFSTFGAKSDGSFKNDYPDNYFLVPLGHWNWKWSEARQKYHS